MSRQDQYKRRELRRQRIAEVYPYADAADMQQLADELGITENTLRHLANKFGIKKAPLAASRNRSVMKKHRGRSKYSQDVIDTVRQYYPTHSAKWIAEKIGVTDRVVMSIAHRNGISGRKEYTEGTKRLCRMYRGTRKTDFQSDKLSPSDQHNEERLRLLQLPKEALVDMILKGGISQFTIQNSKFIVDKLTSRRVDK